MATRHLAGNRRNLVIRARPGERPLSICGCPLSGKGKRWGRGCAWSDAVIRQLWKVGFAYGVNYLIDPQQAIIVDVEATPARWSVEVAATKTVLERTQECFGLNPQRLTADAAYGSGLMIGWLTRRGIEPHIPLSTRPTVSSPVPISPLTRKPMSLSVPAENISEALAWCAQMA